MSSVRELLAGRSVFSLRPQASIREAMAAMAKYDMSALAVLEGDALVGVVTERDLVRKALAPGQAPERLHEIMTRRLITVSPADSTDACMALMIENHVRHLPVLEGGRLVGMLSMRDLVRRVLAEKDFAIRQMTDYISGGPAAPGLQ
jgi:CBS domain-containing protein